MTRAMPRFAKIVLLAIMLTVAPLVFGFVPTEMRTSSRAWNLPQMRAIARAVTSPLASVTVTTVLHYKNEATVETEEESTDVDQRVQDLTTKSKPSRHMQRRPPNVLMVETLAEYKKEVGEERERLVVVRFFADWCRACRAVEPFFYRMARDYPQVKFVDVPVTGDNSTLHQGLGVPSLPYCHIYHPEVGLVEEIRMTRKDFIYVSAAVQAYVKGSCDMEYDDEMDEEDDDSYAFLREEW